LFDVVVNTLNQGDLSQAHLYALHPQSPNSASQAELSFVWQADSTAPLPKPLKLKQPYPLPQSHFVQDWLTLETTVNLLNDFSHLSEALQQHLNDLNAQTVAALCLKQGGQCLGLLLFYWQSEHHFSIVERAIFQALPSLLTPTLANRRLLNRLEEMVVERTRSLQKNEAQYRLFIEETADIITHINAAGQLIYFNPTAAKLWGVTLAEMKGQNFLSLVHPDDQDSTAAALAEGVAHQTPNVTYENRTIHQQTGQVYHLLWTINLSYNEAGEFIAARSIARNITAKKQAEAERSRQQEELIKAQQAAIQQLSTPIIPVMDQIIVLPLVGNLDSNRARNLMRVLLKGISQHRAKIVILDITGVTDVDTHVVAHLDKTIQAARLKGTRPIITGISDAVAEAIIDLGINWHGVETLRDLQSGLMAGLNSLGYTLAELDE
jgi:PAS domain S-box-containing protein